jgi:hypothetical protein
VQTGLQGAPLKVIPLTGISDRDDGKLRGSPAYDNIWVDKRPAILDRGETCQRDHLPRAAPRMSLDSRELRIGGVGSGANRLG